MRRSMKETLDGIEPGDLAHRSAAAAARLAGTPAWQRAGLVLCFLAMPAELDTSAVIASARTAGKTVAVPLIEGSRISFRILGRDPEELPRDRWGIPVPDPAWPEAVLRAGADVFVVTPGLAFDRRGNRLGRGGGYYDGFLRGARGSGGGGPAGRASVFAAGICLSVQVVAEVPHDARDERVDAVVTDEELILPA
jgi:5-formyltetrahydrofolate cyclo-ligase